VFGLTTPPTEYRDLAAMDTSVYERLQEEMRRRGVEYEHDPKEPLFVCEAHTQADVDATVAALAESVKEIKRQA
jgi:glutamate-1-semialdehyde aminotransferase